jgi:quercetin dioxygenase-like cupin family protein
MNPSEREIRLNTLMMRTLGFALLGSISLATAAADAPPAHAAITSLDDVKWGPAPPVLAPGAQMAVLAGDPASTGVITLRLKVPAGYTIAPHWHPTDEHVTVLSGSLSVGMGDKADIAVATTLSAGGYIVAPANMHHFAISKGGAILQVHLQGPFALTYVNPADDPQKNAVKPKS